MINWNKTHNKFGYSKETIRQKQKIHIMCNACKAEHIVGWAKFREENYINYSCKSCRTKKSWKKGIYNDNGVKITKALLKQSDKLSARSKKLWKDEKYANKISKSVSNSSIGDIVKQRWKDGVYKDVKYDRSKIAKETWKKHEEIYLKTFVKSGIESSSKPIFDDGSTAKTRYLQLSIRNFLNIRFKDSQSRSLIRGMKCNTSTDFLLKLWRKHKGRCAITNIKMNYRIHNHRAASIDRIDSSKGYTNDNVHLVCQFINFGKSDHPLSEVNSLISSIRSNKGEKQNILIDDMVSYLISLGSYRGMVAKDIKKVCENSKGICEATGIPVKCDGSLFSASLDRIDSSLGHTVDNLQLVTRFYNFGKRHLSDVLAKELINEIRIPKPIVVNSVDFAKVQIKNVPFRQAEDLIMLYHYTSTLRGRGGIIYGALFDENLIAVCVFSNPTRQGSAPRLNCEQDELLELSRFCINPEYQVYNLASWFLSRAIKLIKKDRPAVKKLISFADATHGHVGTIYKATNWILDGVTKPNYEYVSQNGVKFGKRGVWKQAKALGLTESVYVRMNNLIKQVGRHKYRYIYALRP